VHRRLSLVRPEPEVRQPQRTARQGRIADASAADGGGIDVRELTPEEVERVDARLPLHRLDGAQTYFVAWLGHTPVGHAHVAWTGTKLGVPEVQDVFVVPEHRRQGIATALSRSAERESVRRGHHRISLSVGVENGPARRLYERLGYGDAGLEPERVLGTITIRGAPFDVDDTLLYLVKDLPVIRALEPAELPVIERVLPRFPGVHGERLAAQQRGDGLYLFAWIESEPAGHAYVSWSGRADHPEIRDVAVTENRRRNGIGTLLMDAGEEEARRRQADWLGLVVALDNDGARAFYDRRGYTDTGGEPFTISYQALGENGRTREVIERCTYLRKRVDFARPRSS
jgi:ribosomal protein S18 acetylase RimI-like enzyme